MKISIAKESDWFEQLDTDAQDAYVKEHPRSKYTAQHKADKKKQEPKKTTRADMLTEVAKTTDKGRVGPDNKPLPLHIQQLGIPPAWTDVHYSKDPNADLLCTGRDAKGRLQPVYSEKFSKTQAEAKFLRVQALAGEFKGIQDQNAKNQKSRNLKIKDNADCMSLIMATGLRPGSDADTGAEKKAYGATTLRAEHVTIKKGQVVLNFVGKKGVNLSIPVEDPVLAAMLKKRKKLAGADGKLFPKTNDTALQEYSHTLDGGNFKPKDFRTNLACSEALKQVATMSKPSNEKEYKKAVMDVAKSVSKKLGNTPVVCLQSYINPVIFASWRT